MIVESIRWEELHMGETGRVHVTGVRNDQRDLLIPRAGEFVQPHKGGKTFRVIQVLYDYPKSSITILIQPKL